MQLWYRLCLYRNYNRNFTLLLERIVHRIILATSKHQTATQWETQTVHNDVIRQFLFIQLKYETIYCRTTHLTYNAICFRTLRNFNYSLHLIHVWSSSLSSFPTDDYIVNFFVLYIMQIFFEILFFYLKTADLRYINMKFTEIIILSIWNVSCIMILCWDKKLERQIILIPVKLTRNLYPVYASFTWLFIK